MFFLHSVYQTANTPGLSVVSITQVNISCAVCFSEYFTARNKRGQIWHRSKVMGLVFLSIWCRGRIRLHSCFCLLLVDCNPAWVIKVEGKKKKAVSNGYRTAVPDARANRCNQREHSSYLSNIKARIVRNVKAMQGNKNALNVPDVLSGHRGLPGSSNDFCVTWHIHVSFPRFIGVNHNDVAWKQSFSDFSFPCFSSTEASWADEQQCVSLSLEFTVCVKAVEETELWGGGAHVTWSV